MNGPSQGTGINSTKHESIVSPNQMHGAHSASLPWFSHRGD